MSSNADWSETRKEAELNDNGELVVNKITYEKVSPEQRMIIGMSTKDFIDSFLKILGLATILISGYALYYQIIKDQKVEREKEIADQKIKESQFEARINDQKIALENFQKYVRDQNRQDSSLSIDRSHLDLQRLEFENRKEQFSQEIREQSLRFQEQQASTIDIARKQMEMNYEIARSENQQINEREKRSAQIAAFKPAAVEIELLLAGDLSGKDFAARRSQFFLTTMPTIRQVADSSVSLSLDLLEFYLNIHDRAVEKRRYLQQFRRSTEWFINLTARGISNRKNIDNWMGQFVDQFKQPTWNETSKQKLHWENINQDLLEQTFTLFMEFDKEFAARVQDSLRAARMSMSNLELLNKSDLELEFNSFPEYFTDVKDFFQVKTGEIDSLRATTERLLKLKLKMESPRGKQINTTFFCKVSPADYLYYLMLSSDLYANMEIEISGLERHLHTLKASLQSSMAKSIGTLQPRPRNQVRTAN